MDLAVSSLDSVDNQAPVITSRGSHECPIHIERSTVFAIFKLVDFNPESANLASNKRNLAFYHHFCRSWATFHVFSAHTSMSCTLPGFAQVSSDLTSRPLLTSTKMFLRSHFQIRFQKFKHLLSKSVLLI